MRIKLIGIASLLAVSILSSAPATAQVSYPMSCRGGGTITIRNDGNNGVQIRFRPGKGAVHQGLAPGQCTWSDRGLRQGEPTVICDNGARAAQYVGRLVESNSYMTVDVYNNRQGCMQVTRWVT